MIIERNKLIDAARYIDTGNMRTELNYLYVDKENMVSTNTRAVAIVKHNSEVEREFYIDKKIVDLALKEKDAHTYTLGENYISCLDKDSNNIVSLSKYDSNDNLGKFPKYDLIVSGEFTDEVPYVSRNSISGILAMYSTVVDEKYIPKNLSKNISGEDGGKVCLSGQSRPVFIFDSNTEATFAIMPIIDTFEIFRQKNGDGQ